MSPGSFWHTKQFCHIFTPVDQLLCSILHKNGPTTYNEHFTVYNIMTFVCLLVDCTRCSEYFVQLFEPLTWLVCMLACVRLCVTSQLSRATLGAVANYRHFVSNERCSFELNPPPPSPSPKWTHYMHMEKCWPRNAGIVCMMRYTWWCLALRSILRKACDVPGSTEGLFSCFFLSGVGACLPTFVLRITDSASDGARSWRLRVSSAEDVDKLKLGHEGLPVGEVFSIGFLRHRSQREVMQNHRQQSKNADFSSKRTSFDPPPSQTNIVRLKQNAGNWRRPLNEQNAKMHKHWENWKKKKK